MTNPPPYPQVTEAPDLTPLDVLWLAAGLNFDGDTISVTAATQPSIEDLIRCAITISAQSLSSERAGSAHARSGEQRVEAPNSRLPRRGGNSEAAVDIAGRESQRVSPDRPFEC